VKTSVPGQMTFETMSPKEMADVFTERHAGERDRPRRAYLAALGTVWAMTEEWVETVLQIANRENDSIEAVEARLGRELDNTQSVTMRDGVATIPIRGPLMRYGNLLSRVSGASSYQVLATDFTTAIEDSAVKAVLLAVDSPGGTVNGVEELGELIYKARGIKPIVAHVSNDGASAAYWIASAADEILAGKTAVLGSIGVRSTYVDYRGWEEKQGIHTYEFLSSQSPKKKFDPEVKDDRARLQVLLDDLAEVMGNAIGRNRGITAQEVFETYGAGDVMVGERAVDAGLADRIGTYEEIHAELAARVSDSKSLLFTGGAAANDKEPEMSDEKKTPDTPDTEAKKLTAEQIAEQYPDFVKAWRKEGADAERARLKGIDALAEAGHEDLIQECKDNPDCTPETAAFRMKLAEKKAKKDGLDALEKDEEELDPPDPHGSEESDPGSEAAIARRILSAGRVEVHKKTAS